jgi:hypothetical protein
VTQSVNIRWSDGDWLYVFRCRECNCRYERRPTSLPIGPMFLTKAGDRIVDDSPIGHYETVMVYDGPRRDMTCADCLLKPCFPIAIGADIWSSWCADTADVIDNDPILRAYIEMAQTNADSTIGYPESLCLSCLRCGGDLHVGRVSRRCPNCGDSDRIDLIKSQSLNRRIM